MIDMDLTYSQAVERIDEFLAASHPRDLKSREVDCVVVHWREPMHNATLTFVEARVFTTRGVYGKRVSTRYRFGSLMQMPFAYVEDVPEHEAGRCDVCTLRYRLYNGLGLDVDDLPHQLGYSPQSEIEAARRWTKAEIAVITPPTAGLFASPGIAPPAPGVRKPRRRRG